MRNRPYCFIRGYPSFPASMQHVGAFLVRVPVFLLMNRLAPVPLFQVGLAPHVLPRFRFCYKGNISSCSMGKEAWNRPLPSAHNPVPDKSKIPGRFFGPGFFLHAKIFDTLNGYAPFFFVIRSRGFAIATTKTPVTIASSTPFTAMVVPIIPHRALGRTPFTLA